MAHSSRPEPIRPRWTHRLTENPLVQVLSIRDFRLLWIGAFFSFTGSWIQNVAQGYLVYQLTRDESKLALVSAASSIQVLILGLFAGSLADRYDMRRVLILCQLAFGFAALYLAAATHFAFVSFEQIVAVAALLGCVASVEMPTRQSIVSRVVDPDKLAIAVPVQAMTFNSARIIGPAIGGLLLARVGPALCYSINACTYLVLISCVVGIGKPLTATGNRDQNWRDSLLEGTRYIRQSPPLRTLLVMESLTAVFGIFLVPLIPAYVDQVLRISTSTDAGKIAIGNSFTAVGVGALTALLTLTQTSDHARKTRWMRTGMVAIAVGLVILATAPPVPVAYAAMAVMGGCTIMQFNSTNAMFQILAPDKLRARVLSVHVWALNGFSPFGVMILGNVARQSSKGGPIIPGMWSGVPLALSLGAVGMLGGALWGYRNRDAFKDLNAHAAEKIGQSAEMRR
ncbi:MAG: MFS transporter [Fimbriimonadaceae bacterium]|nr:MFS transporter [Fimbriimonadaceae bacterium]